MKQLLTNNVVVRAFKTFVQAFLAALAAGVVLVQDVDGAKALLVASIAAGLSAAWNGIVAKK